MRGRCRKLQSLKKIIPYGRHTIDQTDRKCVDRVLKSDWLTQGPEVPKFEAALAQICNAKYAVAVSSGTAALHLAALAIGLSKNDEAITSPISFVATSNAFLYAGANPVFADIHPQTINLSPEKTQVAISKRTRAIFPVHFGGLPADMPSFFKLAKKNNLQVIEDASHAIGASYSTEGKRIVVGSCAHSDAAIFSFHPVKMVTTAEGGAITTNRKDLYDKLLRLRTHGITRNSEIFKNRDMAFWSNKNGKHLAPWYYEMQDLGFNYRMSDLQAALGLSQLRHLKQWVTRRQEIARKYDQSFSNTSALTPQKTPQGSTSAYHIYVIRLNLERLTISRGEFFHKLMDSGIRAQVHYIPIHLQPYYRNLGFQKGQFPESEKYYEETVTLPLYPSMKDADIHKVIKTVLKLVKDHFDEL